MKNTVFRFGTLALALNLGVSLCGWSAVPGNRLSKSTTALTAPEILKRLPVVIYYANDRNYHPAATKAADTFAQLVQTLKVVGSHKASTAALKTVTSMLQMAMEKDEVEFPKAVDEEITLLRELFCSNKAPVKAGLVVVRNAGSISLVSTRFVSVPRTLLRYEYCMPPKDSDPSPVLVRYLERQWDAQSFPDLKQNLLTQPLSNSLMFEWFLADVQKIFPNDEYRFAFFGKSRGSRAYYFEPPIAADVSKLDPSKLADLILKWTNEVQSLPSGAASARTISAVIHNGLEELGPAPKEDAYGNEHVEKGTFLQWFRDHAGADNLKNMHFSHVVMDSNYGLIELSPLQNTLDYLWKPPSYANVGIENVDFLHLRTWVSDYQPFQLGKLFPPFRPAPSDFMEHFGKHIEAAP